MRSFSLASGSSGNCFYVESVGGIKVLVDVGLSFKRTKEILESRNIDIIDIDGVFITHEHADHCSGLNGFIKNLSCKIYLTKGTFDELKLKSDARFVFIKEHIVKVIDDLKVFVVSKSHDAKEPVSFVFESEGKKVGFFTDLGYVNDEVKHILKTLDIVYFEANYCTEFLKEKNFNYAYVSRVESDVGHLSVKECCRVLKNITNDNQKIVLSHISHNTNSYENAYLKIKKSLKEAGIRPNLFVCFQSEPSEWIE